MSLSESDQLDAAVKKDFFYKSQHALGRTALCLSGGGSLAMYHMGVIRVMIEHQVLPSVISGSSGGSIVVCECWLSGTSLCCSMLYGTLPFH